MPGRVSEMKLWSELCRSGEMKLWSELCRSGEMKLWSELCKCKSGDSLLLESKWWAGQQEGEEGGRVGHVCLRTCRTHCTVGSHELYSLIAFLITFSKVSDQHGHRYLSDFSIINCFISKSCKLCCCQQSSASPVKVVGQSGGPKWWGICPPVKRNDQSNDLFSQCCKVGQPQKFLSVREILSSLSFSGYYCQIYNFCQNYHSCQICHFCQIYYSCQIYLSAQSTIVSSVNSCQASQQLSAQPTTASSLNNCQLSEQLSAQSTIVSSVHTSTKLYAVN